MGMCRRMLVMSALVAIAAPNCRAADGPPALLTAKPMTAAEGADPLRKLVIERYNAALAEVQKRHQALAQLPNATYDIEPLCQAAERLRKAGAEAAATPDAKVKFHETDVELAKYVESRAEAARRSGVDKNPADLELARYQRADAEIELLRAKKAAATGKQ